MPAAGQMANQAFVDPSWANMSVSNSDGPMLKRIHDFPLDKSVYGVRGLSGNTSDWTATPWDEVAPENRERLVLGDCQKSSVYAIRGGYWNFSAETCERQGGAVHKASCPLWELGFDWLEAWVESGLLFNGAVIFHPIKSPT